jgi:hypothetical protein
MQILKARKQILLGALLLLILALAACAPVEMGASQTGDADGAGQEGAIAVTPGELQVVDARSRATPPTAANGAAYLTVLNGTEETVRLVNVETDVAGVVELHETVNDNGVMRMIHQPEGFAVEPGESLLLEPGGKHIMLMGLQEPLAAGDTYELTLVFADRDPMPITVSVVETGAVGTDAAATGHDQMSHDSTAHGEGGEMDGDVTHQPAWAVEFEQLDVSALHHIDETVNNTGTIEVGFVESVRTFQAGLMAIDWPSDLRDSATELSDLLTELDAALAAEDVEAAAPLASAVHDAAHDLEHAMSSMHEADAHGEDAHDEHGMHETPTSE